MNKLTTREERQSRKKKDIGKSKSSLHAKAFVIDRKTLFIGSMNLDPRSVIQNTEIGVVIHSQALAGKVARGYDEHIDDAAFRLELKTDALGREQLFWHGRIGNQPQAFTTEPLTSFWRRLGIGLARWLPIESQI